MRVLLLTILLLVSLAIPTPGQVASHPQPVARVNGVPIMSDRLDVAINALLPLSSFHQNVTPEKRAEVRKTALQNLIDEELKYQEAQRLKLRVTDQELDAAIERVVKRYGSRRTFDDAMKKAGARLDELERSIKRMQMIVKAYEHEVGSKCTVAEKEAQAFYEKDPGRFLMPEQLHVYMITVGVDPAGTKDDWAKGRATAEDIIRQLSEGGSFEELARKISSDPSKDKGGDLGFVHRGRMGEEFENAMAEMRPGQVSGIIQTIYGFHIMRLSEIRPPIQKSFEEMKAQLVRDLTDKRCGEMVEAWTARLRSAAKVETFEPKQDLVGVKAH